MDVQRKGVKKRKTIVYSIVGLLALVGLVGAWKWAKTLKPAAPGVELSTLWPDTVKRGPMVREVRGLGTLVPEDTVLLTATTDSTVKKNNCEARRPCAGRHRHYGYDQSRTGDRPRDR